MKDDQISGALGGSFLENFILEWIHTKSDLVSTRESESLFWV